jgi:hypothetical protein
MYVCVCVFIYVCVFFFVFLCPLHTAADLISLVLVCFSVRERERESVCVCVCVYVQLIPPPHRITPPPKKNKTQAEGVTVTEVFVDTVGDPDMYQRKLQGLFSHVTPAIQVGNDVC